MMTLWIILWLVSGILAALLTTGGITAPWWFRALCVAGGPISLVVMLLVWIFIIGPRMP